MLRPLTPSTSRLLAAALLLLPAVAAGQPLAFGSSDDPFELGSGFAPSDLVVGGVYGGPAYLPDTWRGAVRAEVEAARGRLSAGVAATLHPAAGGLYEPEADDAYDAVRAVQYLRLNATPRSRVYARLGPTERMTLGVGALVRGYRTTTAYDERTLGLEVAGAGRRLRAGAFADDLRLSGVVGGQVSVATDLRVGPLRDVTFGLAAVHDLALPGVAGDSSLTGIEASAHGLLLGDGVLSASPFVAHARYLGKGSTLGAGLDLAAEGINDALRARARAALFVSTADFVPGHVSPFYAISNTAERVVIDRTFFDDDEGSTLAGTPLDSLGSGFDLVVDFGVIAFGTLEVSQHVRRHVGADRASAYGVRVAGRVPGGPRLAFELQREGFRGLFDLFGDLGDFNALVLDVGVPVGRGGEVLVRSRYGYRRLGPDDGVTEPDRFLVERRFEPLVGLRLALD